MSSLKLSLSKKELQGGREVLILVNVSGLHHTRFRIKSGIYANPSLWNDQKQTVIVPPKRSLNAALVTEAQRQQAAIASFCNDLLSIIDAAREIDQSVSKELVEDWLSLRDIILNPDNGIRIDSRQPSIFTPNNIQRACQIRQEEDARRRLIEEKKRKEAVSKVRIYDTIPLMCARKQLSYTRTKNYKVLAEHLKRYECFIQQTRDKYFTLELKRIDREVVEDFRLYLQNEHELQNENPKIFEKVLKLHPTKIGPRGSNTIVDFLKKLRAVTNWLIEIGDLSSDPFKGVKVGTESYGTPYYLTAQEIEIVANFDLSNFNESVRIQRDIMLFHCACGARVSDLMRLTESNIGEDGILRYCPIKTKDESGALCRIPLNQRALELVGKYRGIDPHGRLFPFITEQKYNERIKFILRTCGIDRKVVWRNPTSGEDEMRPIYEVASSHMLRRCFVGLMYKEVKDPNLIGAMSGHVPGSRAFDRYREIQDDDLWEVINSLK